MKGYLTSYAMLQEEQHGDVPQVRRIEVPIIQRDYAQGRREASVKEIRTTFLEVLFGALAGQPVGLDFVYGEVEDGTLRPLDGQQRLTTLFLLHWYIASGADQLDPEESWTRFSYATRPSARLFCQRLIKNPLPHEARTPSAWIIDQHWYLHVWEHDPTIQAMLVMIDAIHEEARRVGLEPQAAWERLMDPTSPAITFYLLPLADMGSDEELYIKMNSRGKPLTPFENFKARFEQDIKHSDRADEFAHKIDGAWSDLIWPYHGGDYIVDDEFINYIDFITEICEWRDGRATHGRLGPRARAVFGPDNKRSPEHLAFLFHAFDKWGTHERIPEICGRFLSTVGPGQDGYDHDKVRLFGAFDVNLFRQSCQHIDNQSGRTRSFSLQQSLLLYALLLHLSEESENFPRRLRVLRNLLAASEDELRRYNMPALLADTEAIILRGDLEAVDTFRPNQVADEVLKQAFLDANPDLSEALFRLEDHPILRGTLSAFEFDAATFRRRARAFEAAFRDRKKWLGLTGALLTDGDYQRQRPNSLAWQFGTSSESNEAVWRYLLAETTRANLSATRMVLGKFLDRVSSAAGDVGDHFKSVMADWLAEREDKKSFDWRYYLVRYPSMREGSTGIYYGVEGSLGYSLCMLRTQQRNGLYRDPILLQAWLSSGIGSNAKDPWFTGYEWVPRWLTLLRSGVALRSVAEGFEIQGPDETNLVTAFEDVCQRRDDIAATAQRVVLKIPQLDHGDGLVDAVDRTVVGAAFLKELVAAGL
jgi:hypothetical protein